MDKRSRETSSSEKNGVAATLYCRILLEVGGVVLNTSKGEVRPGSPAALAYLRHRGPRYNAGRDGAVSCPDQ